jgi:hypothetical protein
MSDLLNVLSEDDEALEFDTPAEAERPSKYAYASGVYGAVCTSITPGITAKGDKKVVFGFTLQDGPGVGVLISSHVPESILWKGVKYAKALGYEQTPGGKTKFPKSQLVGKPCRLDLKQTEYNGKQRMEIFAVLPPE